MAIVLHKILSYTRRLPCHSAPPIPSLHHTTLPAWQGMHQHPQFGSPVLPCWSTDSISSTCFSSGESENTSVASVLSLCCSPSPPVCLKQNAFTYIPCLCSTIEPLHSQAHAKLDAFSMRTVATSKTTWLTAPALG